MTSPARAHQPILTKNINGTSNLTFTLYSRYYDRISDKKVDNPFLGLMVNERKVKLKYDGEWYDFVIKNISENSDGNTFSYTCKNLFINELSKTGFNIELDTELENNQGNIVDLANTILEESDWKVDEKNCDLIQQRNEEPLYEIKLNSSLTAYDMNDQDNSIVLSEDSIIYGFYSSISEQKPYFQFLYREDGDYAIDDDRIITNSNDWFIDGVSYIDNGGFPSPTFAKYCSFSDKYRGNRLVRKEKTIFDAKTNKYVSVYKDSQNQDVYGFTETEYIAPTIIKNLITNSENFPNTQGWLAPETCQLKDAIYPQIGNITDIINTEFMSLLKIKFPNSNTYVYNSGIQDNKSSIRTLTKGEQYVFRIKYGYSGVEDSKPGIIPTNEGIRAKIAEYTLKDGNYTLGTEYLDFSGNMNSEPLSSGEEYSYQYLIATCKNSISYSDFVTKKIGLFLYDSTPNNLWYSIMDIQLFQYKTDADNKMVIPGVAPQAIIRTIYYYYAPVDSYTSEDDIVYLYKDYTPSNDFTPVYDNSYEKIRSITASESNRFNMIQDLCETFECWADFRIEHNLETGEILLDENYRQKKWISFKNYIGKENWAGFKYGINLKDVQRTIDSESFCSKIIVKENSNQYAIDGFCTIARAKDNPIKENFLYNFKHYINQGLLDFSQVNNDLYLDAGGYLGYYVKLRNLNKDRDEYIEEQSEISNTITDIESNYQVYQIAADEAEQQLLEYKQQLYNYTGHNYEDFNGTSSEINKLLQNEKVREYIYSIKTLSYQVDKNGTLYSQAKASLEEYNGKLENIKNYLDSIANQKTELNRQFYTKYSRFIQEGTWISEDYIDDNLYYLDAEAILNTSAQPQVSYTINVLEISQIPGFENYNFGLGDKTYIEDTEFFGWTIKNGVKTPYQEEIIISEVSYNLDSPDSNKITVQNYKTQFEDLFQRITATTQSVQYSSGEYGKISNIVTSDNEIKPQTLQNSFTNNALIISNAKDQSVVWNDNGMLITSLSKPNEIIRLVSGGIFLSNDGGDTWTAAINGNGINANHITSGQIDASKINILAGAFTSFRWDEKGLNAYKFDRNDSGEASFFNFGQFIRFDQYGLYGMRGDDEFTPSNADEIKQVADFGFTWNGFFLKSNYSNIAPDEQGYITIDSENDFQVIDGKGLERIKIGRLGTNLFGIRFSDENGLPVMITDDEGQLFLQQKILIGPDISDTYRYRAQLGIIESYTKDGIITTDNSLKDYSKIFSIKDQSNIETVAIYDNGLFKADKVELTGTIYATGGKIGNLSIDDLNNLQESGKNVEIESLEGNIFKIKDNIASPSTLTLTAKLNNISVASSTSYTWSGSNDFDQWITLSSSGNSYIFNYEEHKNSFNTNGTYFIKLSCIANDEKTYTSYLTLNTIEDGSQGEPGQQTYVWIKYSAYSDGTEFSDEPNTYIGIYTGPSVSPPLNKEDYIWSKFQGDDAAEGSTSTYIVESNQDRILKFHKKDEDNKISTIFSPVNLKVGLRLSYQGNITNQTFEQYYGVFELAGTLQENNLEQPQNTNDGNENGSSMNYDGWINLNQYFSDFIIPLQSTTDSWYELDFNLVNSIVEQPILDEDGSIIQDIDKNLVQIKKIILNDETVIRFKAIDPNTNKILAIQPFEIKFGSSYDMATFELNSAGINAAIQNTKLQFDANGLTIYNGGIRILNNNNKQVLYANDNGDLTLEGVIYASSGIFNGTVNATNGIFNGTINASDGTLGNLSINGIISVGNIKIDGRNTIDEIDNNTYELSKDIKVNFSKKYFNLLEDQYILIDLTSIINPSEKKYYEFINNEYKLTEDTIINLEKNYYTLDGSNYQLVDLTLVANPSQLKWYENSIIQKQNQYQGIYINNYTSDSSSGFYISSSGEIVANTIILGDHASIKNYISLGNETWIFNPSSINNLSEEFITTNKIPNNAFIVINRKDQDNNIYNNLVITSDGLLRLGDTENGILLNGSNQSIQSINYNTSNGWYIDSNQAIFNNIIARGSIKSSVLEYSNIQAIGGILIVRPSSIIKTVRKSENGNIFITIENRNGFSTGDYCKVGYSNGLTESMFEISLADGATEINDVNGELNGEDGVEIELLNSSNLIDYNFAGLPFIDFGRNGDIGIGINSSKNNNLVTGNALSLFELQVNSTSTYNFKDNMNIIPRVILGQIPDIPETYGSLSGKYGLYADNVLLKGSMIANGINYSSGINTESEAVEKNSNFPADRRGSILLWAGADSDSVEDIENAKFRVDTYGNLYAGSGYFQGTIITDATITAAEIKTATITGYKKDSNGNYINAALNIQDTEYGINFTNKGVQRMSLTDNELKLNTDLKVGDNFIIRNNSSVIMPISFIYNQQIGENCLIIQPNSFGFTKNGLPTNLAGIDYQMYINYDNGLNIIDSTSTDITIATFNKSTSIFNSNIRFNNNLLLQDIIEYREVRNNQNQLIGYDLYVQE